MKQNPYIKVLISILILELYHLLEDANHHVCRDRLRHNLIHLVSPGLIYVLGFCVAGARDYHRLLQIIFVMELSDVFRAVVTIHNRHITIHENNAVGATISAGVLDDVERVLAVSRPINEIHNFGVTQLQNVGPVDF